MCVCSAHCIWSPSMWVSLSLLVMVNIYLFLVGLTVLFIGRDMSLVVMSFYLRYITLPKPVSVLNVFRACTHNYVLLRKRGNVFGISRLQVWKLFRPLLARWGRSMKSYAAKLICFFQFNTGLQLALIGATMCAPVFHFVDHPLLHTMWYVTGVTTVASGLSYIIMRNGFSNIDRNTPCSRTWFLMD